MSAESTYDEVPYPPLSFPRSHPARLAALGKLFGLAPPPPSRARVLELGCAAGSNLLPMGSAFPAAEFLGVDLSARQVEAGEQVRQAVGIGNVTLKQADLMSIDASWGKFDYILAHGLFSWVPEAVQEKIFSVCRENLATNGIAYISYNIFPGWHFKLGLREMMLYHVARFDDPSVRIRQARALVDFLAAHGTAGPHSAQLKSHAEWLRTVADHYLFHEYLEAENHPVYFSRFAARAGHHGLRFLSETRLSEMNVGAFKPEAAKALVQIAADDVIRLEQYLDFLGNRSFRETLLVHDQQPVRREMDLAALRSCWINLSARIEGGTFNPQIGEAATFILPGGEKIRLRNADALSTTTLAALLQNAPRSMPFSELAEAVGRTTGGQDEAALGKYLLEAWTHQVVEVVAEPWPCAATVGQRPMTTALARFQAGQNRGVTTLRHIFVKDMSPNFRQLIGLLDGNCTIGEIVARLEPTFDLPGEPTSVNRRDRVAAKVAQMLDDLRAQGLLLMPSDN